MWKEKEGEEGGREKEGKDNEGGRRREREGGKEKEGERRRGKEKRKGGGGREKESRKMCVCVCLCVHVCMHLCSESQPGGCMEPGVGAGWIPPVHSQGTHQAGLVSEGGHTLFTRGKGRGGEGTEGEGRGGEGRGREGRRREGEGKVLEQTWSPTPPMVSHAFNTITLFIVCNGIQ